MGLAYFHSRGLEDATIEKFGLGWAPSSRTALTDAAIAAGHKLEYLIDAGLSVKHEDGSVTDRFRERVMFPIHSVSGRVIAFSGRTLKAEVNAKYVNSPETEIYTKSKALLGIFFAKAEISRQDKCYLVEGNVDVITMQQLGIANVVASCGTSLTVEQIRLIHRFTSNLTILYDGDKAGIHAALRGTDMVLAEGMNVRIVLLPDGEDPVSQITIVPRGQAGGMTISLPEEDRSYLSKQYMEDEIVALLGGRVAEQLCLGDISTGASNDIQRATAIALIWTSELTSLEQ